ncbi:hypothetical protein ACFOY8_13245 [Thalassospira xianhensis]|uniref:hypothetical protein n=1 Tax=Thalassospira xianhensis TaxID=478503 RepID=UPI000DEE10C5|nr:hypothetical protein [Thalassospira xianhensis]
MSTADVQKTQAKTGSKPTRDDTGSLKFGLVLFDDENDPKAGWCSVNGSPAKRIEGMNELATDTLWWSNMTYESFFRTTEAWRNPWLRHDAYLVTKPKDVLQEWGYDPATSPADFIVKFCSMVFARMMTMAAKLVREALPKLSPTNIFTGNTLREDLRRLLPEAEFPRGEAATIMRQGQAFAEFTRTTVRGIKGARIFVLRKPRVSYAFQMLTTPVPVGPFDFLPRSELRSITSDRVEWIRTETRPCMVEVAVQQMEAEVAPVYGFGNSMDKDKRIPRSWVAHPEFLTMAAFSEIEVKSAWVGKEYAQMNLALPDPVKAFLSDRYTELSWCAGVIAETLWRAAALGEPKGRMPQVAPEDRAHTSWRGAWLKAADKTAMFLDAMKLTEMGYATVSYGLGWVSCLVTDDQIPDLVRDAMTIGLMPKFNDVPDGMFAPNRPIPWGGDQNNMTKMLLQFTMTKDRDFLWNFDKLPLYDKGQREQMLRQMLEARKNQQM